MSRMLGCMLLLPMFESRFIGATQRNAVCLALSLPQIWLAWYAPPSIGSGGLTLALVAAKELAVGALLGTMLAMPFWIMNGVGTLIDNQRGANAAQMANPSLQADASILGELCQRSLITFMADMGLLSLLCGALWGSYAALPITGGSLSLQALAASVAPAFTGMISSTLMFASPVLLMLLLVELAFAICSSSVQGLEVYQTAMPVKSLLGLFMLVLYFPAVLRHISGQTEATWAAGLFNLVVP